MNTDYCDIPIEERTAGEFYRCALEMGGNAYDHIRFAYSVVWNDPGSATVLDWTIVFLMPILFIGAIGKIWRSISG